MKVDSSLKHSHVFSRLPTQFGAEMSETRLELGKFGISLGNDIVLMVAGSTLQVDQSVK